MAEEEHAPAADVAVSAPTQAPAGQTALDPVPPTVKKPAAALNMDHEEAGRMPILTQRGGGAFYECRYLNKGDVSNFCTFCVMLVGIVLNQVYEDSTAVDYILAFGLFGFAGGITNWLAIKMLFDRVPFLYGSGVIPRQFKEIRLTVKNTIMKTFFDGAYLEQYISERSQNLVHSIDIGGKITEAFQRPDIDQVLTTKFVEIGQKPEGAMLAAMAPMFGGEAMLAMQLKPMLLEFGKELANMAVERFDIKEIVSVDKMRDELDALMTEKLKLLTPAIVKKLMEEVMRKHLGWLIVWGCFFGGMIGVLSVAAGYS